MSPQQKDQYKNKQYQLQNTGDYSLGDPRRIIIGAEDVWITEETAEKLNYALALNGSPNRLVLIA